MKNKDIQEALENGYDYKHLIKEDATNEEILSALMNHSRGGPVIQAMVMEGLRIYATQVVTDKEKVREEMGDRHIIHPDLWIACAEDVLSALNHKQKIREQKESATAEG